jgi:hypothetical protein
MVMTGFVAPQCHFDLLPCSVVLLSKMPLSCHRAGVSCLFGRSLQDAYRRQGFHQQSGYALQLNA